MINQEMIDVKVEEYHALREQSKVIKTRMDALAKDIKAFADKEGVKDDKGSIHCENSGYTFGKQAKKSVSFIKEKAIAFFTANGLDKAVRTELVIDEGAVENYITEGKITFEDLEDLTETKTTYAMILKKKEVQEEVVETVVESSSTRKPLKKLLGKKR